MDPARVRCMLDVPDGPSRRVGPNGVVIGRQRDCDVVASDASVSRRHALVRLTLDGAEIVPLARGRIEVNGVSIDRPHALSDGDELRLPGLVLRVSIAAVQPDAKAPSAYVLERARGGTFGIAHTPFMIGGDPTDDLIVKRWPKQVLCLHLAQGELFAVVRIGDATRNGHPLVIGELEPIVEGDEIGCRGETFVVRAGGRDATTAVSDRAELPNRVEIEMLPRGGRVVFTVGATERAVYLADRRLDLMIALLRPPEGFTAGEFIPDDVVRTIVWPRNAAVTRPEINTLISRCRRDLVEAGLAGPRLLERSRGGGATCIRLAPNAAVVVKS